MTLHYRDKEYNAKLTQISWLWNKYNNFRFFFKTWFSVVSYAYVSCLVVKNWTTYLTEGENSFWKFYNGVYRPNRLTDTESLSGVIWLVQINHVSIVLQSLIGNHIGQLAKQYQLHQSDRTFNVNYIIAVSVNLFGL